MGLCISWMASCIVDYSYSSSFSNTLDQKTNQRVSDIGHHDLFPLRICNPSTGRFILEGNHE